MSSNFHSNLSLTHWWDFWDSIFLKETLQPSQSVNSDGQNTLVRSKLGVWFFTFIFLRTPYIISVSTSLPPFPLHSKFPQVPPSQLMISFNDYCFVCVCVCIRCKRERTWMHTCIYSPLNPFNIVHMYTYLELTTWDWISDAWTFS